MDDYFDVLTLIAERKIREAIDRGWLDNLPGAGKPLPEDDLANLPEDLRLSWRILRAAGYTDKSPESGKISNINDLLEQAPDERHLNRQLTRLKLRIDKKHNNTNRANQNDGSNTPDILESEYLDKLLQKTRP
jgi:hypothetical protein